MAKREGLTIAAPSWKRASSCFTHRYLPDVKYVVCTDQADGYRAEGVPVWECPNSAQGNLCRVRNWIMDQCETKWLLLVDDDLSGLGRFNGNAKQKLSTEQAMEAIVAGFELAEEFGVRMWGINCLPDKGAYREYTPFSLNNYLGGPFQAFIDMDLRYDESLPLKEDYDLTLQVMNKYRKALRINYLHYEVKQHTNAGGCASYRTISREMEQFELLQRKWGDQIVRRDSGGSKVDRKREQTYDINPIIKVPIGGV